MPSTAAPSCPPSDDVSNELHSECFSASDSECRGGPSSDDLVANETFPVPFPEPNRAPSVVPAVELSCTPAPAAGETGATGVVAAGAAAGDAEEDWQKKAEATKMAKTAAQKQNKHEDEEQKRNPRKREYPKVAARTATATARTAQAAARTARPPITAARTAPAAA